MGDVLNIQDSLITSCNKLYSLNQITDTEYNECVSKIGDNRLQSKLDNFEKDVFGDVRSNRLDLKQLRDNLDDIMCGGTGIGELKKNLNDIKYRLNNLVLEKNISDESSDYYNTLNLYSLINENLKKKKGINENILTLNEKKKNKNAKLLNINTTINIVFIVILVVIFMVLLIIYLKF